MKCRMGMNVIFVRLLVRERRKVVAEEIGVSNASNSSVQSLGKLIEEEGMFQLTNRDSDILDRVSRPLLLLRVVEAQLWVDI